MIGAVTNLTASVIITLSSAFSDGVDLMEKKEHAKAVEAFTTVIDAERGGEIYLAPALFLRAKARVELNAKDEAKKDVEKLFAAEGSANYWRAAAKLYSAAGGKPKTLMPKKTPIDIWEQFMAALRAGNGDKAAKFLDDDFSSVIRGAIKSREFEDVVDWLDSSAFKEGSAIDAFASKATLFCVGADEPGLTIYFARKGNEWKVSGMYPRFQDMGGNRHAAVHRHGAAPSGGRNEDSVESLVMALSDYVWEFEAMPAKLEDLLKGDHLENRSALMWVHPAEGKKLPFIYMMDVVKKPAKLAEQYLLYEGVEEEVIIEDMDDPFAAPEGMQAAEGSPILVVAPAAFKGRRDIGNADGWESIDESEFVRKAITEGWKIEGLEKSIKTPEDIAQRVAKLMDNMRSGSSAKRKQARDSLVSLGIGALAEIKKYEKDRDPEIRESIKDIMEKMK